MPDDQGLLDLLAADHENLRADLEGKGQVGSEESLERHLTAERALLYPLIEKRVPDGREIADRLRRLDRTLVEAVIHQRDGGDASGAVLAAFEAHVRAQDEQFAVIQDGVPSSELVHLAGQLPAVVEEAPTRLHPGLPDSGPFREIASELAAEADQLRRD
jgi:hypothetical protein